MKKYSLFLLFPLLLSLISCKSPLSEKTFKGNGLLSDYSFNFQDDKFYFCRNDNIIHEGIYKKLHNNFYILTPNNLNQTLNIEVLENAICYNNEFY